MIRIVSKDLGNHSFTIKFDSESDVYEYSKDGNGECQHDVHFKLIEGWATNLGFTLGEDLYLFTEQQVAQGHGESLVNLIESATKPKFEYMSGDDIEGMFDR